MLLSNNDIKKELSKTKNLCIHPLNLENIKGSSINLTASAHAWNSITYETLVEEGKKIVIPPNTTASIYTQEAIWVSRSIGGTYHPRVSLVAKGLSNISTTLDPQWYGLSLITVHNNSDKEFTIRVGEPFVSVMLHYLKTKATKGIIDNQASRPDLYSRFTLTPEDEEFLGQQWHRNYHGILKNMKDSDNYKYLHANVSKRKKFQRFISNPFTTLVLGALLPTALPPIIKYVSDFIKSLF